MKGTGLFLGGTSIRLSKLFLRSPRTSSLSPLTLARWIKSICQTAAGGSGDWSFYVTTREKVKVELWNVDNTSSSTEGSLPGLHTLVAQVTGGTLSYFVDGKLIAQHGGQFYPDAPVSINFDLWFMEGGLLQANGIRQYKEDIDWVFHEGGLLLMPEEVIAKVNELKNTSMKYTDTVISGIPTSPCDL